MPETNVSVRGSEEEPVKEILFGDFEVNGVSYVVRYTTGRVKMFEAQNRSLMSIFAMSGGAPSISELESMLAYGMCVEGGEFVNPKEAVAMASRLVEERGYWPVYEVVVDALGRDCNFLFRDMPTP